MPDTPAPAPTPPPDYVGTAGGIVKIIQSMTLTHVLIIALLVAIAIPSFVMYRAINDASLLNKFMSYYEEVSSERIPCTIRIGSQRGAEPVYSISTGFAFQGSDRWTVGVILTRKPDDSETVSYCATLNQIVDYMRRPNARSPTYPNSEEPLIWQYPSDVVP